MGWNSEIAGARAPSLRPQSSLMIAARASSELQGAVGDTANVQAGARVGGHETPELVDELLGMDTFHSGSQFESELPRRSEVIAIGPMLRYLSVDDPEQMEMLHRVAPTTGLQPREDPAVDRNRGFG
jgi:hypothetical protein